MNWKVILNPRKWFGLRFLRVGDTVHIKTGDNLNIMGH